MANRVDLSKFQVSGTERVADNYHVHFAHDGDAEHVTVVVPRKEALDRARDASHTYRTAQNGEEVEWPYLKALALEDGREILGE